MYPYAPPDELTDGLWQIRGSLAVPIPRYMTVYRLADGRLVLYSVIAMHAAGMARLEALGTPAFMVMPHDRHQMDAAFYKQRYPHLRVLAPDPSYARSVAIDGDLDELATLGITAYPLPGTRYHETILEVQVDGGVALCTTELLANVEGLRGLLGFMMRWLGPPGGKFGVNRLVRWREVVDRGAVRTWLRRLGDRSDIRMILMGHAPALRVDVQASLQRAARYA